MFNYDKARKTIVAGLKNYIGCPVIRSNQNAEPPAYPYASYTITTLVSSKGGTYSIAEDGTRYRQLEQIWSFTIQSDDQSEAVNLALKAYDFFALSGITKLADEGVIVHRVQNVSSRDNLLTIEYEYRSGLDVTFGLLHKITDDGKDAVEVIESLNFKEV